jgi:predicted dehydrogenase
MPRSEPTPTFVPYDRPIRVAVIGLGRIYDLNIQAYVANPDVEIVALVDTNHARLLERSIEWPDAKTFSSIDELAKSGLVVDAVEVLLPIALHEEGVLACLANGWHVNLQKPFATDVASAMRMIEAAREAGRQLRVMENYIFYEPLVRLKSVIDEGAIGPISGYHLKMVASGRGGWEVPGDTYQWQFDLAQRGRGVLVFDDGWHKFATALWLFGPVREVRAWIGATEIIPGITVDAPSTIVWEHENGIRGVWDITLAVDMYLRSDYYTNDERWEVTGQRGFARVNRCTGRGIQEPSFELYLDGEMRSQHALDDDWASSFRDSGRHWINWLHKADGPLFYSAEESLEILKFVLATYESSANGGVGVRPNSID